MQSWDSAAVMGLVGHLDLRLDCALAVGHLDLRLDCALAAWNPLL